MDFLEGEPGWGVYPINTYKIHGNGIFTYIYHKNQLNVAGKYTIPRWWFQTFFIFNPKIGEDEPILTNIFQMGWFNHQPVDCFFLFGGVLRFEDVLFV